MSLDHAGGVGRSPHTVGQIEGTSTPRVLWLAAVVITLVPACGWFDWLWSTKEAGPTRTPMAADPNDPCVAAAIKAAQIDREGPRDFREAKLAFDRGIGLQQNGRHAEALVEFRNAVAADPTFGLAYLEAAFSHLYTDNAPDALSRYLSSAVILLPKNPRAQLQFARFQREVGDAKLAERHFGCALAAAPQWATAHESLARLYLTQGRIDEAETRARSAVTLAPDETTYRVLLADVLSAREMWMEAGAEVERAAQQIGRSAALYRRAADLYARAGANGDADRLRAVADEIDPPPERRRLRPLRKR